MEIYREACCPQLLPLLIKAVSVSDWDNFSFHVTQFWCESWTIKKAEHQRIEAFKLWCERSLLRVPRTARRSNQSILKEINPDYSLEGLMLKLQHFSHLNAKSRLIGKDWCSERLKVKGEGGRQSSRWLDSIIDSKARNLSNLWETVRDRGAWRAVVHGVAKSWIRLGKWTTTICLCICWFSITNGIRKEATEPCAVP